MSDALAELEKVVADPRTFLAMGCALPHGGRERDAQPADGVDLQQINEVRGHRQWSKLKDKVLTPARIAAYNAGHRALFDALQARDADTAIEILNEHLAEARRDLFGAQST
jgi:hypothetical protein